MYRHTRLLFVRTGSGPGDSACGATEVRAFRCGGYLSSVGAHPFSVVAEAFRFGMFAAFDPAKGVRNLPHAVLRGSFVPPRSDGCFAALRAPAFRGRAQSPLCRSAASFCSANRLRFHTPGLAPLFPVPNETAAPGGGRWPQVNLSYCGGCVSVSMRRWPRSDALSAAEERGGCPLSRAPGTGGCTGSSCRARPAGSPGAGDGPDLSLLSGRIKRGKTDCRGLRLLAGSDICQMEEMIPPLRILNCWRLFRSGRRHRQEACCGSGSPERMIATDFHPSGSSVGCRTTPPGVISSPPKPNSTACSRPPAPVMK